MSKERLKEFKDYIDYLDDSQDMQDHGRFIDTLQNLYSDGWLHWIVRYAKEQAERVCELETLRNYWYDTYQEQVELSRRKINKLQERVQDLEAINKELHDRRRKLRIQNKHFREAIEDALNELHVLNGSYENESVKVAYGMLLRALEGEE